MSEDFLCQADCAAKGTDGVAPEGALQFGNAAEAEGSVTDSCGCVWCDVGLPVVSVNGGPGHETRDAVIYLCTKPKNKIEEPGTGDEVEAENKSDGLTPHQTKAQEIINWTISEGTKDFTALHSAIVSALTQSYQSGRQEERERAAKIVEAEHDRILASQYPGPGDLSFAASVNTYLRMMAVMLPDLAHAIRKGEASPEATGGDNG